MKTNPIPTPLTDAAPKAEYRDAMFCELVSADFARDLERELTTAMLERDKAELAERIARLSLGDALNELEALREAGIMSARNAEHNAHENTALRDGLRELLALLKNPDSEWVGAWETLEKFDDLLEAKP